MPKFGLLGPYNKTNGEITSIHRLMTVNQKVRKEGEDWDGFKKLPEDVPAFSLTRELLLGTDSVVHTPRLKASETKEKSKAKFSESMD